MTPLARMRQDLEAWWQEANPRFLAARDSMGVQFALRDLYASLSREERECADIVFGEWLDSDDPDKAWDGWAMIAEFRIASALPQLQRYLDKLIAKGTAPALGHAEDVRKVLQELSS